jgi:hypothetical protein
VGGDCFVLMGVAGIFSPSSVVGYGRMISYIAICQFTEVENKLLTDHKWSFNLETMSRSKILNSDQLNSFCD